jgi:hypothetical protein
MGRGPLQQLLRRRPDERSRLEDGRLSRRVLRGGDWSNSPAGVRSANRNGQDLVATLWINGQFWVSTKAQSAEEVGSYSQ